ncbi:MAG: putative actinophage protein [Frankiales bacterium]|nr:putative actinophage protein [Frankiales bacterium]
MPEIPFTGVAAIEGVETSDRRIIDPGALTWRDLPLSLMAIIEDSHGGMPTTVSVNVGRIETFTRQDATDLAKGAKSIAFTGVFDGDDPVGAEVARKVSKKFLRGVSIDVGDVESELEVIEEDEDGWPTDWLERLTAGTIGMATVCGFPAFANCFIEVVDTEALAASVGAPQDGSAVTIPQQQGSSWRLVALTAAAAPVTPPRSWYDDPQLPELTPLTITDDGRVFGHMAAWGQEHRGLPGADAPRSPSGYAHFHLGATRCDDGTDVPTGVLTIGTGHAPTRGISAHAAAEHYDNTGSAWADVRVGEDAHGIWVAGSVRPDVDEVTLRRARGSALSGDWRRFAPGSPLELMAALSVNVPGFAIPRPALVASMGEPVALVAAGAQQVVARGRTATRQDIASAIDERLAHALHLERRRAEWRAEVTRV